ncbi:hypothetical protein OSTOST_18576, partial [Ostertagia ostertagi]
MEQDPAQQRRNRKAGTRSGPASRCFTKNASFGNYWNGVFSLLLTVCSEVESQLERVIMKCSFNRLGGLQLDREFRQLSAYLSGVAGWTARERCARLSQIVALLNVENVDEAVELREATRTSPIARMLSANDTIKVLELRVDLPAARLTVIIKMRAALLVPKVVELFCGNTK